MTTASSTAPDSDCLRLYTPGLTSKWGFDDGDLMSRDPRTRALLREVYEATGREVDHHELLTAIVRHLVLPHLDQHVELRELATLHNPARAATVDGVPLDLYGNPPDGHDHIEITPDIVEVPLHRIRTLAMEMAENPAPEQ